MIQITRILFIIFLISSTTRILSAHQEHFSKKNESIESSNISPASVKYFVNQDLTDSNYCDTDDLKGSECCCCFNGMCFQFDKKNNCGTDKTAHQFLCKSHCEDAGSNDNNIINQNVKSSNGYKINFLNYFSANKESKTINTNSTKKTITQSTPAYISTHSFLI